LHEKGLGPCWYFSGLDSSAWQPTAFSLIDAHSSPFAWLQNDPNSL